jgi:trans-aconitate 2-methyltransferase
MSQNFWNAQQYSLFLDARTRPARDLLAAIPDDFSPSKVVDLGCGPGNSTVLLKKRWPQAQITGIDTSLDMLQKARLEHPAIQFEQDDISHYTSTSKVDCLFANASLQWCDHHPELIKRLSGFLTPGGFLAIQIPNNFHMPGHQAALEVLHAHPEWEELSKDLRYGVLTKPLYNPHSYYECFLDADLKNIQIWQTEYFLEMDSYAAIFDWMKSTGLHPILAALDEANKSKFRDAFIERLSHKFPLQSNQQIFWNFTRLFMVGMRRATCNEKAIQKNLL